MRLAILHVCIFMRCVDRHSEIGNADDADCDNGVTDDYGSGSGRGSRLLQAY